MKNKPAIRLNGATPVNRLPRNPLIQNRDLQFFQNVSQHHFRGAIHDDPQGAFGRVLTEVGDGSLESRVAHARHGNEEMIGQVRSVWIHAHSIGGAPQPLQP